MYVKVALKNSDKKVLLDEKVFNDLFNDEHLKELNFFENLREHSNGYVFFQKNYKDQETSKTYNETIYLHKLIAEKYIPKPNEGKRWFVRFKNGIPHDCRLSNLEWTTFSYLVRNTKKVKNSTGYRGVIRQGKKYYAYIYINKKNVSLGAFDTPEEAAYAYNKKSLEVFGKTNSLNQLPEDFLKKMQNNNK
jgi:hypothetical protein